MTLFILHALEEFRGSVIEGAAELGVNSAQTMIEIQHSHADRSVFKGLMKTSFGDVLCSFRAGV
jgi:hypothetical protein